MTSSTKIPYAGHRFRRDTGIDQDRAQSRTAVGKAVSSVSTVWPTAARQRRISASIAVSVLATATKTWRASSDCFDVAAADFQMPLARLTAADDGRVQGQGDRRRRSHWLGRGRVAQLLADPQGSPAHGLGMDPGIDRQKVLEQASGAPIGHESGQVGPDLIDR
jgi:hypothetical protein